MSRNAVSLAFFLCIFSVPHTVPCRADESAVRQALVDYVAALNAGQIDAVAACWTESATHTDRKTGERTEGRAAIRADIQAGITERPGLRLSEQVERVRMITPHVARVKGTIAVAEGPTQPAERAFSAIMVHKDDKWLIES